jgi:hypothetical protein
VVGLFGKFRWHWVAVGLFDNHIRHRAGGEWDWERGFVGAQVMLRRNHIGIVIVSHWCDYAESYASLDTGAMPYYCRFTSDGLVLIIVMYGLMILMGLTKL